jgi:hypothetical protein
MGRIPIASNKIPKRAYQKLSLLARCCGFFPIAHRIVKWLK